MMPSGEARRTNLRSRTGALRRTPDIAFILLHRLINARDHDGEDIVISGGIGYPTPPPLNRLTVTRGMYLSPPFFPWA
jgi:hypothetical protein